VNIKKITLLLLIFFAAFIPTQNISAQIVSNIKQFFTPPADTNFIKDYSRRLITRIYLSDKIQSLKISSPFSDASVKYKPNNKYSLGVGLTYRFVTLNIGFGIGSQDPNKGKTSSLDLQTNIYRKDWSIDLLLQSYKGYYISSKGYVPGNDGYYSNRDLHTLLLGGGAWRMLNEKKFSYKATMTQSQWQQKSSGSFVVGGVIYYGNINANGNMIPDKVVDSFSTKKCSKNQVHQVWPGRRICLYLCL